MRFSISDYLRRVASMIEREDERGAEPTPERGERGGVKGTKQHDTQLRVHNVPLETTVAPQRDRPHLMGHERKKNCVSEDMAGYMREKRNDGSSAEWDSPNSKYVKKPRIMKE